ncbi:MAG: hypothetical protein HDS66_08140 [Bacteroidales bacterium]|nr:hypothetical protein [Bacteroidales bacterium]
MIPQAGGEGKKNRPRRVAGGGEEMSLILTIVVSAVVSFLVAYVTAKRCFDKIDGYVRDVTDQLKTALDEFMNRFGKNQENK